MHMHLKQLLILNEKIYLKLHRAGFELYVLMYVYFSVYFSVDIFFFPNSTYMYVIFSRCIV